MSSKQESRRSGKVREESLEKILSAASTEFVLQGFKGTTVQSIADRAQLPKANILYYFKNKENLYHGVLDRTLQMWDQGIGEIVPREGPRVAIEKIIDAKVKIAFKYPEASKIYAMEIIQGAPNLKEFARTYQRKWVREKAALFQSWIDAGEMKAVDPVHLIFLIWSSTQHYADFESQILTITNRAEYEQEDIESVAHFLKTMILRGCGLI